MQDKEILQLYAKHDSCRIVAEKLGISGETVRRCLIKHGIQRTGNRAKERNRFIASCANRNNCYALFRMIYDVLDVSAKDIAEQLSVNSATVWNACCKKRGIHSRNHKDDFDLGAIEREYLDGATSYELGNKYNVDHTTISRWMRQCGNEREKFFRREKTKTCIVCGKQFRSKTHNKKYCSKKCFYRYRGESDYRSRAFRFGVDYDKTVTLEAVYEHDDGVCYICGKHCELNDILPSGAVGNLYPTIDHVTPMSKGGGHVWGNVRLAHKLCNSIKQDRNLSDELKGRIIDRVTECSNVRQQEENPACVA